MNHGPWNGEAKVYTADIGITFIKGRYVHKIFSNGSCPNIAISNKSLGHNVLGISASNGV